MFFFKLQQRLHVVAASSFFEKTVMTSATVRWTSGLGRSQLHATAMSLALLLHAAKSNPLKLHYWLRTASLQSPLLTGHSGHYGDDFLQSACYSFALTNINETLSPFETNDQKRKRSSIRSTYLRLRLSISPTMSFRTFGSQQLRTCLLLCREVLRCELFAKLPISAACTVLEIALFWSLPKIPDQRWGSEPAQPAKNFGGGKPLLATIMT